jgi:hypothetical protein
MWANDIDSASAKLLVAPMQVAASAYGGAWDECRDGDEAGERLPRTVAPMHTCTSNARIFFLMDESLKKVLQRYICAGCPMMFIRART